MLKFDKIKTSSEKRLALEKRGKTVNVDFVPGMKLILSEKLDGFNASIHTNGTVYSRSNIIDLTSEDARHYEKLRPIAEMGPTLAIAIQEYFDNNQDYQVFGEFMVTDRIVPYEADMYNKWYVFDIYDFKNKKYLGPIEAQKLGTYLQEKFPNLVLPVNILDDSYEFTSYEDLEEFVYSQREESIYGKDGIMEGMVAFSESGLRAKIINKEFKETQRSVANDKAHSKAVRWLNQYLTEPRVKKLVKNALLEGVINPNSPNYFKDELQEMVKIIHNDILEESIDTPSQFSANDLKNIHNKIEAKTRFVMLDEKNYSLNQNTLTL